MNTHPEVTADNPDADDTVAAPACVGYSPDAARVEDARGRLLLDVSGDRLHSVRDERP